MSGPGLAPTLPASPRLGPGARAAILKAALPEGPLGGERCPICLGRVRKQPGWGLRRLDVAPCRSVGMCLSEKG